MEEILKAITTLCIKVDSMDNEIQKLKTNEDNLKSKASQQHDYKNAELSRSEDSKNPEIKGDVGKHLKNHNICLNTAAGTSKRQHLGNLASVFYGDHFQIGSNVVEYDDSMDYPTSMNANALMADSIAMDEQFSMMDHWKASHFADLIKEKEFKKGMTSNIKINESMVVKATSVNVTTKKKLKEEEAASRYPKEDKRHPTFKELEAKVYLYPNSYVPMILDKLLAKKFVDLSKSMRSKEINNIGDPKYYKFHRVLGHLTSKCFILKEKIIIRNRQVVLRKRLPQTGEIRSDMDQLHPSKSIKPCINQKINSSLS
ncbi:hypothetical protein H5410_002963 [Solanum commersonii]|uniref:Uncharacterized protein n=1 Tax=Solanum commersonii TaxID=4109 RepID=A0A9J6B3D8_SOLCO|nr:hypothetical protein H5410_002963 [Solanum commersonii]